MRNFQCMHGSLLSIDYPVSHGETDKPLNLKRIRNTVYNTKYSIMGIQDDGMVALYKEMRRTCLESYNSQPVE